MYPMNPTYLGAGLNRLYSEGFMCLYVHCAPQELERGPGHPHREELGRAPPRAHAYGQAKSRAKCTCNRQKSRTCRKSTAGTTRKTGSQDRRTGTTGKTGETGTDQTADMSIPPPPYRRCPPCPLRFQSFWGHSRKVWHLFF